MEALPLFPKEKEKLYPLLAAQLRGLLEGEAPITGASNGAALLYQALPQVNWAGFYLVSGGQLILGPFQGKPACTRIGWNKGVCGAAWAQDAVQRVANVHDFPGHIACDGDSRSEIVLPLHAQGQVVALLDIDSPVANRFDQADQQGLEACAQVLEQYCHWPALAKI